MVAISSIKPPQLKKIALEIDAKVNGDKNISPEEIDGFIAKERAEIGTDRSKWFPDDFARDQDIRLAEGLKEALSDGSAFVEPKRERWIDKIFGRIFRNLDDAPKYDGIE